jgi:hypothetical protein
MITITIFYGLPCFIITLFCLTSVYNWLVYHVTVILFFFHIFSFLNYYINEMVGIKSRAPQNTWLVLSMIIIEVKSNDNMLV